MSQTHVVKSWPAYFEQMIKGVKKHDMRGPDRNYQVGDIMVLQEYDPFKGEYTGREATFLITYITSNVTPCALSSVALQDGYKILSVELVEGNK